MMRNIKKEAAHAASFYVMPFCKSVRWKPTKVVEPFGVFADGAANNIIFYMVMHFFPE